jgi:hypothetical protein
MSKFELLDRSKIQFDSVENRKSKLYIEDIAINPGLPPKIEDEYPVMSVTLDIQRAREKNRPVILCMGAHAIKNGCGLLINDMVRRGFITHVAINGAAAIHDWEFAKFGKSTECVKTYLETGQFGLWKETLDFFAMSTAFSPSTSFVQVGWGENIGEYIYSYDYKFQKYSILHTCYDKKTPCTIHASIGQDIIYASPALCCRDLGKVAMTDFLIFAESVRKLENGGVFINCGSSVTGPMIFEKALSMARNIEHQENRKIQNFTIAVNDIAKSTWDWSKSEPPQDHPDYYLRFMKTFHRAQPAKLFYYDIDNRIFLHNLQFQLKKLQR